MKVFEALQDLKDNGPDSYSYGICSNLGGWPQTDFEATAMLVVWGNHYGQCFSEWDKFSGSMIYPIPSGGGSEPHDAFDETDAKDMWNPDHPYGANRLLALDHCINWFKEKDL